MKKNKNSYAKNESYNENFLRQDEPEIYKLYTRKCLKCDIEFDVYNKFIRICLICKQRDIYKKND